MKEILPDKTHNCVKQASVQIELALNLVPAQQIYTPNPHWDSLENTTHDPYWDTLEQDLTSQQQNSNSCDILNPTNVVSVGNLTDNSIGDTDASTVWFSAHQQNAYVGEQLFIANQDQPSAPQQYKSVGAQVTLDTKSDISETSVGAQVTNRTEKFAPQHDKLAHWVERYWVERAGNKYWYFRYRWMSGRKSNRIYLGSVRSRRVQEKVEVIRDAIAKGKSPGEIKQLIKGEYD